MKYSIQISYRDENKGGGAFYDHYSFQKITGMNTEITVHPKQLVGDFEFYVESSKHTLPCSTNLLGGKKFPGISNNQRDQMGLLVIPGCARETAKKRREVHNRRSEHEAALLKEAQLIGRPVLAICAGAWTLWQSFGGSTRDCEDHCYRGGMPRILDHGNVGYNKSIHDVQVLLGSQLSGIVKTQQRFSVNSVHWQVVNETGQPESLQVSARAQQNDGIAPKSPYKKGCLIKPEADVIEAFETSQGVPMLGIQWHPEAYDDKTQHAIIKYMAFAGVVFAQKRQTLQEMQSYFQKFNEEGFFSPSRVKKEVVYKQAERRVAELSLSEK